MTNTTDLSASFKTSPVEPCLYYIAIPLSSMVQLRQQDIFRKRQKSKAEIALLLTITGSVLLLGIALREIVAGRSLSVPSSILLMNWNIVASESSSQIDSRPSLRNKPEQTPAIFRQKRPTIHVLGERHSGTKWITQHLVDCFNQTAQIRRGLTRWKHWFRKYTVDRSE